MAAAEPRAPGLAPRRSVAPRRGAPLPASSAPAAAVSHPAPLSRTRRALGKLRKGPVVRGRWVGFGVSWQSWRQGPAPVALGAARAGAAAAQPGGSAREQGGLPSAPGR